MVDAAQLGRVDAEQPLQVVVADVVEVPAAADVARHAGLPARVVHDAVRRPAAGLERRLVGDVGEGQALGGEADLRPARVLERAPVAADAVVVGDAAVGAERAARRRTGAEGT